MRNPHKSVAAMPRARAFGLLVAELLDKAIELWPDLVHPAIAILRGEGAQELPEAVIDKIRASFLRMSGGRRRPTEDGPSQHPHPVAGSQSMGHPY